MMNGIITILFSTRTRLYVAIVRGVEMSVRSVFFFFIHTRVYLSSGEKLRWDGLFFEDYEIKKDRKISQVHCHPTVTGQNPGTLPPSGGDTDGREGILKCLCEQHRAC